MLAARRYRFLMLLLIVVSYAAFSVHTTIHTTDDLGGCELCAGHGDPSYAIPASPVIPDVPVANFVITEIESTTRSASLLVHYHQRAPPNFS